MEAAPSQLKQQLDIIYRSHPILPSADCEYKTQDWSKGRTVREILLNADIDQHQPIVIILDDRLLTVEEWDTVCPEPGQILNVKAEVEGGGGGGGSNALQIVAMIAIVVVAVLTYQYELLPAAFGMTAATTSAIGAGVIMAAGSMLVNSVFAAQIPAIDMGANGSTGQYGAASPTYSLSGAQNRSRPYESMPVIMGTHRHVPDNGAKPYTEYHGEDQYLYQIFHLGLSSCDRSDWKVGTNPLSNYADWWWSYSDQSGRLSAFPGNVDSTPGAPVEQAAGWIYRTTSANTYRIGIDLEGTLYHANDQGGMDGVSVQLRVQYCRSGSGAWIDPGSIYCSGSGFAAGHYENYYEWVSSGDWGWHEQDVTDEWGNTYRDYFWGWQDTSHYELRTRFVAGNGGTIIVSGNSQTPRRATIFIDVPVGTYDVRIIRDTADSTEARTANKTNWSSLRSYQLDTADYTGQNRMAITIRASEQLNGVIQQMSYLAGAYAYYWNGSSWVWSRTSNPAHWFMDFAKGRRDSRGRLLYGIGLADNQIDLPALNSWANFCAAEGLSFNAVLDSNQTAADILTAITRCGFASPTWASGKLGVVWDARNQAPVMAFGMSNIVKDSFQVSYITEQLAEEVIVRYTNPDKDWSQDEVRVLVPGVTTPTRSSTVDLFGCTSTAMAGKFANYLAAQQHYRKRHVQWECDFEGFVCQRGDVVILSHDLTQWGYSGRIVDINGEKVTLDRAVPRNGATEYLMIRKPDGTLTTYNVVPSDHESDTLLLTSYPDIQTDSMDMDHMWFFSPLATPGKRVKILSVAPVSDSRVKVIATDEDPEFYRAWDGSWISPSNKTLLLDDTPRVSNFRFTEVLYRGADKGVVSRVNVSWDTNGVWERANVRYRVGNDAWVSVSTFAPFIEFDTTTTGQIEVRVLPVFGIKVGPPASATAWASGVNVVPSDVTGLTDFYRNGKMVLKWDPVTDVRDIKYEIRKGASWANSQILGQVTATEFTTDGNGLYWVAAVVGSVYSVTPASIETGTETEGANLVANVVATWNEEATGWKGTCTGGAAVVGTDVVLQSTGLFTDIPLFSKIDSLIYYGSLSKYGEYEIPAEHIVDIGHASACNVSVSYRIRADSLDNYFSHIQSFSNVASLIGNYAGQADVKILMAVAPDSGVFTYWRDFVPGTYYGRKFKFKAALTSKNDRVSAVLDMFQFTVDVPDRLENGTNAAVPATGASVKYAKPFQVTPNVQITILGAKNGDDAVLTNQSSTGFDIVVKDINDSPVARSINWIAQGY